ncbi:hypothetical protein ACFY3N_14685 [Streptomyces sp. NPDC000348]|uniref:hypothetical protein n=1 Tax=Streptomyces sp. NPDC000348 TaxID=3364538 RepID=UPI003676BDC4
MATKDESTVRTVPQVPVSRLFFLLGYSFDPAGDEIESWMLWPEDPTTVPYLHP